MSCCSGDHIVALYSSAYNEAQLRSQALHVSRCVIQRVLLNLPRLSKEGTAEIGCRTRVTIGPISFQSSGEVRSRNAAGSAPPCLGRATRRLSYAAPRALFVFCSLLRSRAQDPASQLEAAGLPQCVTAAQRFLAQRSWPAHRARLAPEHPRANAAGGTGAGPTGGQGSSTTAVGTFSIPVTVGANGVTHTVTVTLTVD